MQDRFFSESNHAILFLTRCNYSHAKLVDKIKEKASYIVSDIISIVDDKKIEAAIKESCTSNFCTRLQQIKRKLEITNQHEAIGHIEKALAALKINQCNNNDNDVLSNLKNLRKEPNGFSRAA